MQANRPESPSRPFHRHPPRASAGRATASPPHRQDLTWPSCRETDPNPGRPLTVVPADKPRKISAAVAAKRFVEFFAATIRNRNTRAADAPP